MQASVGAVVPSDDSIDYYVNVELPADGSAGPALEQQEAEMSECLQTSAVQSLRVCFSFL